MNMLEGKVVLVTGAAQGIGATLARGLVERGAAVIAADIEDATPVARDIEASGGRALAVRCDVTDAQEIEHTVQAALDGFQRLDGVVNNAALFGRVQNISMFDIDMADWDQIMAVNARGPWLVARAAIPAMEQIGGGAIVNVSTNRVFVGTPELLHYDASKGAVVALTRSMAREVGGRGIRVNCVAPGLTMSENVRQRAGIDSRAPLVNARRAIQRDQQPEDLVGAVAFLLSDDARFITGQTLVVDGGSVMH
ncbi:MAG: glucose 1-dehydrogenase [Gammaproteobacteria bacterium]|nr:glucose 1-dehydrogenase [Gammaproteobacteria bacterium]